MLNVFLIWFVGWSSMNYPTII
jgi:hypothetical protein